MDIDQVRLSLLPYRDYCQDILEARLRSVLYEQLNITRDIPFDKVVRLESSQWPGDRQPILATSLLSPLSWSLECCWFSHSLLFLPLRCQLAIIVACDVATWSRDARHESLLETRLVSPHALFARSTEMTLD